MIMPVSGRLFIVVFTLVCLLISESAGFCRVRSGIGPELRAVIVKAESGNIDELPIEIVVPARTWRDILVDSSNQGLTQPWLSFLKAGDSVPCQVERVGDDLRISWIAQGLTAGKSTEYQVHISEDARPARPKGVRVTKGKQAVDVTINGRPFTRYVYAGGPRPYCYPIIGPTGVPITRNYPMVEIEDESKDHPHHRSLWFTFGNVNGVDFWTDSQKAGKIVHRRFEALESGPVYGRICAVNDWIAPNGRKVCEDRRDLRIYRTTNGQLMDIEITIRATEETLKFGDTKEGMFAIRVASSMEVDRGKGHIENSQGDKDADAWGKQAEWCDYYGPVDGKTVGIAIMEHPTSFRHPTYWHVRTYGLFAANPFGLKEFLKDKKADGSHIIPEGGEITFRYRIFFHHGKTREAKVADVYAAYANPPRVTVR